MLATALFSQMIPTPKSRIVLRPVDGGLMVVSTGAPVPPVNSRNPSHGFSKAESVLCIRGRNARTMTG